MCTYPVSNFLRFICSAGNSRGTPIPLYTERKSVDHGDEYCLLHTSLSSRSSHSLTSMGTLARTQSLQEIASVNQYFVPEENPEAMFDMLTIQTLRERYQEAEEVDIGEDISVINGQDFESFVRDFPIDDSISECFASNDESTVKTPTMSQKDVGNSTKPNKLKKKLANRSTTEENVLSDEDSKSSDSKRSKLISNIFGRKHKHDKNKDSYKQLRQSETKEEGDITNAIIDACQHITDSYVKPKTSNSSVSSRHERQTKPKKESASSVNGSSDISDESKRHKLSTRKLPPVPDSVDGSQTVSVGKSLSENDKGRQETSTSSRLTQGNEFGQLDSMDDTQLINFLSQKSELELSKFKSSKESVTQWCISNKKKTVLESLLQNRPKLLDEELLEYSVKCGDEECTRDLLERYSFSGTLNTKLMTSLFATAAEHNQHQCLEAIIPYYDVDPPSQLPHDQDNNTAAHVSARHGHIECIQVLLENGFDIWTLNNAGHSVVKLALDSGHQVLYKHLILFQTCQCLLRETTSNNTTTRRLRSQRSTTHDALEQLKQQLVQYQNQFNDVMRSMIDTQETILQTLDSICSDTKGIIKRTDENAKLRLKLENLKAEADQLQDLFDFSPLANTNDLLTKLLKEFHDVMESGVLSEDGDVISSRLANDLQQALGSLLRNLSTYCQQDSCDLEKYVDSQMHSTIECLENKRNASLSGSRSSSQSGYDTSAIARPQHLALPLAEDSNEKKSKMDEEKNKLDSVKRWQRKTQQVLHHNSNFRRFSDSGSETTLSEFPRLESQSMTESGCSTAISTGFLDANKTSDWMSRLGTITCDTTDTESDWRDETHDILYSEYSESEDQDEDEGVYNYVHLNLENEDLSDDMLRQHRLTQHLQSMDRINNDRGEFIERVILANGKRVGIFDPSVTKENLLPSRKHPSTKRKASKEKRRGIKLFSPGNTVESREISQSEFLESYDRSRDPGLRDVHWEEMSLTDGENSRENEKPWYELSDDEESIIDTWKTDDEDEHCRIYRI